MFVFGLLFFSAGLYRLIAQRTESAAESTDAAEGGALLVGRSALTPEQILVEKTSLGRLLFFDPSLSINNSFSCGACHKPFHGYADAASLTRGAQGRKVIRNVPSLWNVVYRTSIGWIGANRSIESQTLNAITSSREMGLPYRMVIPRVEKYRARFEAIYNEFSVEAVLDALGSYQKTLIADVSPFDKYVMSGGASSISNSAKRGFEVFRGKGRCQVCHFINSDYRSQGLGRLTDEQYRNVGVGSSDVDNNAGRREVTGNPEDTGKYRTPSLRNVALTFPYMHDGSLRSLADVVEFFNRGGQENPYLDSEMQPLSLSQEEKQDLVSFLESLTGSEALREVSTKYE